MTTQKGVPFLFLLTSIVVILQVEQVKSNGVPQIVFDLKYRVSLSSWLIDYEIQPDGYKTCVLLENSCCFLPNKIIRATIEERADKSKAIQFKGEATGNCQGDLILQVVGYSNDLDLSDRYGHYSFYSNIGQSDGSIVMNAQNQFLLAIDDQLQEYTFKLPSVSDDYTDNDSYNYAKVYISNTSTNSSTSILNHSLLLLIIISVCVILL